MDNYNTYYDEYENRIVNYTVHPDDTVYGNEIEILEVLDRDGGECGYTEDQEYKWKDYLLARVNAGLDGEIL